MEVHLVFFLTDCVYICIRTGVDILDVKGHLRP